MNTGLMWYVYFLKLSNGDIYVGSTNDIERRVKSHTSGQVTSTKAHLPATLKSFVAVETEQLHAPLSTKQRLERAPWHALYCRCLTAGVSIFAANIGKSPFLDYK